MPVSKKNKKNLITRIKKRPELGVIISFIIVVVIFTLLTGGKFIKIGSIASILKEGAELAIITIGIAYVLISGQIDLSVGSLYGLSALLFVIVSNDFGGFIAFAFVVLIALIVGFINGKLVTRFGVPSLITSLGFMLFLRGVIYFVTGGFPRSFQGENLLKTVFGASIFKDFNMSFVWLIIVGVVFSYILYQTKFGNRLFATGGNEKAARAMGVNIKSIKIKTFMIGAFLAALAGIISVSRIQTATATTGLWKELQAIASAVMGGCLLTGGYGSILGAVFGALIFSSLRTGLIMSGAPSYWYEAFVGIILVIAAVINISVIKRTVKEV